MPVRAIFKPAIYLKKQFSCACRATTISLKTPSRDRIFRRFGVFWRIRCENSWHSLKAMPHGSEKSPEKNRNEIRHSLCMPHGRVKIVANYEENDT